MTAGFEPVSLEPNHRRLTAHLQTDWAIHDQAKNLNLIACHVITVHSAHLTTQPDGFRIWLWWYIFLLLLILMLWHRQFIFKWKEDKLSSTAECRVWTSVSGTQSAANGMPTGKPTELLRMKLKLELSGPSLWSAGIQHTRPHCRLPFAPGSGDVHICCC